MKPIPITAYLPETGTPVGRGDQVQGLIGNLTSTMRLVRQEASVVPQRLEENFRDFMASMEAALKGVPSTLGTYEVDEIELALELTVSGEVRLLAGAGVEGKAGLTLTLKRPPAAGTAPKA
jgi:hypothetical protein